MRRIGLYIITLLLIAAPAFAAQQTLQNLDTFGVQRGKINDNFTELYGWGDHGLAGYLTSATAASTYEPILGNPAQDGYCLKSTAAGTRSWGDCVTAGDDLGSATYSDVVALWATGSCSGYLKSDGTCDTPSGSGLVDSVFGRTGAVDAQSGDYTADQITETAARIWPTPTQEGNWDTAFGWGDHAGLYSLLAHNHSGVYQPADADLTTYAGITPSANVQSFLGAADYAAMKTLTGWLTAADAGTSFLAPAGDGSSLTNLSKSQVGLALVDNVKHAYAQTIDPGATADSSINYEAGKSLWIKTDGSVFVCIDDTVDAAVWQLVGATSADGISVADSGGYYTGADVETVLAEIGAQLGGFLTSETDPTVGTAGVLTAVTTVADPGSDSNIPTEQAVREAVSAIGIADLNGISAGLADNVDNIGLPPEYTFITDYTDLADALTNIGASPVTLFQDDDIDISGEQHTVQSNISYEVVPGYTITMDDSSQITFNGGWSAPLDQAVFSGNEEGGVIFGENVTDIYLKWFSPTDNGTTDDDYQALANFYSSATGHSQTLWWPTGVLYYSSSQMPASLFESNINIEQRKSIFKSSPANLYGYLHLNSPQSETDSGLSIAMVKDVDTFTIPAAITTLDEGDVILMYNSTEWLGSGSQGYNHGHLCKVVDITGSTGTCEKPFLVTDTADTANVYTLLHDIRVNGVVVDFTSDTSSSLCSWGVRSEYTDHIEVLNSEFYGNEHSCSAVTLVGNNHVSENNYVDTFLGNNSTFHKGYGFQLEGSGHSVRNNRAKNTKHCLTSGARLFDDSDVVFESNQCYDSPEFDGQISGGTWDGLDYYKSPFDYHANSQNVLFLNNTAISPADKMVDARGLSAKFIGNTLVQLDGNQGDDFAFLSISEGNPDYIYLEGNTLVADFRDGSEEPDEFATSGYEQFVIKGSNRMLGFDAADIDAGKLVHRNTDGQITTSEAVSYDSTGQGLRITSDTTSANRGLVLEQTNVGGQGTNSISYKSRNGGAVADGDNIMIFSASPHDGTSTLFPARFSFYVNGSVSTGSVPTEFAVETGTTAGDRTKNFIVGPDGSITYPGLAGSGNVPVCVDNNGTLTLSCP